MKILKTLLLILIAAFVLSGIYDLNLIHTITEAYAADTDIGVVRIPGAVEQIEDYAFQDCPAVEIVIIPDSVEMIGTDAFSGCAEDLLICAEADSLAERYAVANSIDYQSGTVYRALLIGNTYSQNTSLRLYGTGNDVSEMKMCILQYLGTPYDVRIRMDQSADGILQNIQNTFSHAADHDVSIFYYSGHGVHVEDQAALLGNDGESCLTVNTLRTAMDAILGRKVIIIDACYSGGFVPGMGEIHSLTAVSNDISDVLHSSESFVHEFVSAFSKRSRGATDNRYFIIAAAAEDEKSYEDQQNGIVMGAFTAKMVEGCGWDIISNRARSISADTNENSVITIQEIYDYTYPQLIALGQHVIVFPDNCKWFGLLRKIEVSNGD